MKKSKLWPLFKEITISDADYRWIFLDRLAEHGNDIREGERLSKLWDEEFGPKTIVEKIKKEISGGQSAIDQSGNPTNATPNEIGPTIDVKDIVGNNESLNFFLNRFRTQWRETAQFHFIGIGKPDWPPKFQDFLFPEGSFEEKFYSFLQKYPPPRLRSAGFNFATFQRLDSKWEEGFRHQYRDYLIWIKENINAQDHPNYSKPGAQLKDGKGNPIFIQNDSKEKVPLINSCPDYMFDPEDNNKITLAKIASIVMIPATQLADFIWGQDWRDKLNGFALRFWEAVKEALRAIAQFIYDNLPDGFGKFVFLVVAGVGVVLGGWSFVDEEIRKLAR